MKEFDLHIFFRILKQRWLLIFGITAISTSLTFAANVYYITPLYSNSVTLLVNDRNNQDTGLRVDDILLYEKLMGTYKDILISRRILEPVVNELAPQLTPGLLREMTVVSTSANSQVITIKVTNSDYMLATKLANGIAESFQARLGSLIDVNNVQILDSAIPMYNPPAVSPRIKFNAFLGFVISLILSSSLAVILSLSDTRIRSKADILDISELPLLAVIPPMEKTRKRTVAREEYHA